MSAAPTALSAPKQASILSCVQPGSITLLGARPAMGASSLGLSLALALQSRWGWEADYADLSWGHSRLERRLRGLLGELPQPDALWERGALRPLPLRLWQGRPRSVRALLEAVTRAGSTGTRVLFVDWVQCLYWSEGADRLEEDRAEETREALRGLAREQGWAVVALSKLPPALEDRADRRPRRSDFSAMGLPEGWADWTLGLYRPAYYQEAPDLPSAELPGPDWDRMELLAWDAAGQRRVLAPLPFHAPSGRVQLGESPPPRG